MSHKEDRTQAQCLLEGLTVANPDSVRIGDQHSRCFGVDRHLLLLCSLKRIKLHGLSETPSSTFTAIVIMMNTPREIMDFA